jgi:glycosyltransferase involved in cell wall biosynthesis
MQEYFPLITCILPVSNGERYLREALDSIAGQTYRPLEIIVADDGSTDGTAPIVAAYGNRIRYLKQANSGAAAARNLGLGAARGDYVAFLDADDLWHPEKLERQMRYLQARPELAGCVTHITNFWSPELCREKIPSHDERVFAPVPGYVPQTLLARKALVDAVGGFNTGLRHADATDWFLRVREHGATIEQLPDVLVRRRLHLNNLSRRMASASRTEFLQLLKDTLDRRRAATKNAKANR